MPTAYMIKPGQPLDLSNEMLFTKCYHLPTFTFVKVVSLYLLVAVIW